MASSLAERWTALDGLIQRLRYRQVVRHIPAGSVVADLGCGDGDFLRHLRGRIAAGIGIDGRIDNGQSGPALTFLIGDLDTQLPLPDASVDVATALAVLEHLRQPERFLGEMRRVLKPGGRCILTTPAPSAKPVLEFLAYRLRIISEKDVRDHKQYFSRPELARLFSGFRDVALRRFQCGLNSLIIAVK